MKASRGVLLAWIAAVVAGLALRAPGLTAARPYIAYVDEGHLLHPVAKLLRDGGWDPRYYVYPQLPYTVLVAAIRAADPVYRLVRPYSIRDRVPDDEHVRLYDELEPFPLLLVGRCVSLSFGMAIVLLTGLLARRLGGAEAGAAAALLAALTPALVLRSSIATVDPYAAFFVLLCVALTDRTRTTRRPGWVSLAAGAAAGAAFASKYPAALVILAFAVTTAVLPIAPAERLRRLGLAAVGLLLAAAVAMPALLVHSSEVIAGIRVVRSVYEQMPSPSIASQIFHRAEWDLHFDAPELGVAFVLLTLAGLAAAWRDRTSRPTLAGVCAFGAALFLLCTRQAFQPFRNLLPLVPLACVAIALLFARVRRRVPDPRWADALFATWLLAAFAIPLAVHAESRLALVDSRRVAMDWLVAHTRPDDRVLIVRDLGFLDQELSRLGSRATVRWLGSVEDQMKTSKPRFVVAGVFLRLSAPELRLAFLPPVRAAYRMRFCAGRDPTPASAAWWRGNDELVCVLERR